MKTLLNLETKQIFFIISLILICVLVVQILMPFANIILISLIIVQIFHPIYKFFEKKTKNQTISTLISILLSITLFVIPSIILSILIFRQIETLVRSDNFITSLESFIRYINNNFIVSLNNFFIRIGVDSNVINPIDVNSLNLPNTIQEIGKNLGNLFFSFLNQFINVLLSIFLIIVSLIFIFPKYEDLENIFSKISPLDDRIDKLLVKQFKATIRGVLKGSFAVAFLQSTAVTIPLIIIGAEAPLFLWLIMFLLSILPIGSGLVWGPIGIIMIIRGISFNITTEIFLGIGLMVYSGIIINIIDSTIRPKLIKNTVNIHPLIVIFSVLGGLYSFGILGIVYGPLIMVFFLTIMSIYRKEFLLNE